MMDRLATSAGRLPVEPIAALMLGGALAFFLLAMPAELLARAVIATRLPDLFAAAGPPLGFTARALIALAAGGAVGALTWIGLARLDRPASRAATPPFITPEPEAPTLRRADVHPDAPARRPLFADVDLGEPLVLDTPLVEDTADAGDLALPASWAEPVVAQDDVLLLDRIEDAVPVEDAAPPVPAPVTPEDESVERESLLTLIARLEQGLARRDAVLRSATVTPLPRSSQPLDGALRDALAELQKLAGRRG